ncbi:MAG: hypothetical protein IPP61_11950 [Cytophagaceae bacterium]|nr:hypothetical protein [Cytophagaceae bacterium]
MNVVAIYFHGYFRQVKLDGWGIMLDPDYIRNYRIEEYKTSKLRRKLHQKLKKQQTKSS